MQNRHRYVHNVKGFPHVQPLESKIVTYTTYENKGTTVDCLTSERMAINQSKKWKNVMKATNEEYQNHNPWTHEVASNQPTNPTTNTILIN